MSVKYVLIVFDSIDALLMISLTLISTVCSSSKRSQKNQKKQTNKQKKQVVAEKGEGHAPYASL